MKTRALSKRIISIFLTLLIISSMSVPAFAAKESQPKIDFVATMQIVSYSGGGLGSSVGYAGHSFLIFTNTSNSQITVGHFPVGVGEQITIGTFGNRPAHYGIWYNIEGYRGISSTSYGLLTGVTAGELIVINSKINSLDYWSQVNICSFFAREVWNAGNSGKPLSGWNPANLAASIRNYSGYITSPSIPSKPLSSIARHTPNGFEYDSSGAYSA